MNNIKAIIFDIDDTLVDRKAAFLSFCHYFIDKYSVLYPYSINKNDLISYMIEIDASGYGGLKNFMPELNKVWSLPLTSQEFIQERNSVFGSFAVAFPDAKDVLEYLKSKYKLGVITNGYSKVQREKIRVAGIEAYFDDIIVSEESKIAKPDPKIFHMACANLGIKPEEAVYVGDYYPNDIAGAIGAGITPIWICNSPDAYREYSGIRISTLKELKRIL